MLSVFPVGSDMLVRSIESMWLSLTVCQLGCSTLLVVLQDGLNCYSVS